jgi:hypothetical protein
MPIDLAGISNENEFYSEHYLTTIFEGDIEETFREWREQERSGAVTPNRMLEKTGSLWRRLSVDYRGERDDAKRLLIFRQFAHSWLDALGYERHSELISDAEGKLVPVLARRADHTGKDVVWIVEVPSPAGDDSLRAIREYRLDPEHREAAQGHGRSRDQQGHLRSRCAAAFRRSSRDVPGGADRPPEMVRQPAFAIPFR